MEFSRPEYWRGWLFASPGDLPNPGNEPRSPTLQILYCLNHQRSPIFLRNLLNTMENAEASMFNANSGFCSKCSHKLCFTSNVNVIWCDMRSVELRAAIRVEDERYWQQYVPCHSFLTRIFFLKNNFWTCIIWCDLFLHFYIGVQPIISILPQTPLLSMCNDFIECWKDITLYVCVIDLKGNDVAYIYLISPFSNWRYTKGEPSSSPGDVISILDYQSYHRGFIAGANYKRNIYCIQTNDYFLCRKTTCHILWLNVQWEKNFK